MTTTQTLAWPLQTLTPIEGKPNNAALKQLQREIYANTRAIPSTRGGGQHGHLGKVMEPGAYTTLTGAAWTPPPTLVQPQTS